MAYCPCTSLPPGPAWASLTFPQALEGIDVVETKVQLRIYIRGDPPKPKGGVFKQQVLLPFGRAEELERRRRVFSKLFLIQEKLELQCQW